MAYSDFDVEFSTRTQADAATAGGSMISPPAGVPYQNSALTDPLSSTGDYCRAIQHNGASQSGPSVGQVKMLLANTGSVSAQAFYDIAHDQLVSLRLRVRMGRVEENPDAADSADNFLTMAGITAFTSGSTTVYSGGYELVLQAKGSGASRAVNIALRASQPVDFSGGVSSLLGARTVLCSGTYALDAWHYLRLDLVPVSSTQKTLVAYVSTDDGANWSQIGSMTVLASDPEWSGLSPNRAGIISLRCGEAAATEFYNHFVDGFESRVAPQQANASPAVSTGFTAQSAQEGQVFTYTFPETAFADADGDNLTYTASLADGSVLPAWLSFDGATRTFTGTPAVEDIANLTVAVTASDPSGAFSISSFTLAVEAAPLGNQAPTAIFLSALSFDENIAGGSTVATISGSDPENDALTFSLVAGAGDTHNAAFTIEGNALKISASPDYETQSSYSIRIQASDGDLSYEEAFTLAVNDLDEEAPAQPDVTVNGDFTLTVNNAEAGATVEYSLDQSAWSATAPVAQEGENTIYVRQTDAAGNVSTVATVTFTKDTTAPAQPVVSLANDTSGGSLITSDSSLSLSGIEAGATVEYSTDAEQTWGATPSFSEGTNIVYVRQTDAAGNVSTPGSLAFTLDTTAPAFTSSPSASIDENIGANQVVYTAAASDDNGVAYSLDASGDYLRFDVNSVSGAVTLLEDPDYEAKASYSFDVRATDPAGNSDALAVSISVNNLNEAPSGSVSISGLPVEGETLTAVVAGLADPDGPATITPSFVWLKDGVATGVTSETYLVAAADVGSDISVRIEFTDDAGNSESLTSAAVTIAAGMIISSGDSVSVAENSGAGQAVYTISVANQPAGLTPVYSISGTDAASFTVDSSTGAVSLTANPDFETVASYSLVVEASAGGQSASKAISVLVTDVDEVAPTILSGATADSLVENSGANQVVYTASADEDVTWSLKEVDDHAAFSISGANVSLIANPDYEAKSSYSFTVVATDAAGNTSEQAVSLSITDADEIAPVAPVVSLANDTSGGSLITSDAALTLADIEAGATVEYSTDAEQTWGATPSFSEGTNVVYVRQTDAAGNVSASGSLTFTLDTVAPAQPDVTVNGDFTLTVNNAEASATVEYSLDQSAWSATAPVAEEGENTIYVRQTDAAGNVSTVATVTFTKDTTAPAQPDVTVNGDFTLTVNNAEAGATVEYSLDQSAWSATAPVAQEGENTIYVRQTDAAGNVSTVATVTFTKDTTAPAQPDVTVNGDFTLTVNNAEAGATVEYSLDQSAWSATAPVAQEGENTIYVRQTDAAGNVSTVATATFTKDTTAPAQPSVSLANDTSGGSLITSDAALTLADIEEGATVEYSTDAEQTWAGTPSFSEGINTVYVRQTDAAGNVSASGSLTFTLDTVAPVISGSGSVNVVENTTAVATYIANETATWSLSGDDAPLFAILDGALSFIAAPDYEDPQDFSANGVYEVTVEATDAAGNVGSVAVLVTVTNANESPESLALSNNSVDEGQLGALIGLLSATDPDADDTIVYTVQTHADKFDVENGNELVTKVALVYTDATSYSVVIRATDFFGDYVEETFTINVNNVNDQPVGSVTIGGYAQVGETLTASNDLTDADGMGVVTYDWFYADNTPLATGSTTYVVQAADEGAEIFVRASYTDALGAAESVDSAAVGPVTASLAWTSADTGAINENSGADQIVYTAAVINALSSVSYSLTDVQGGDDVSSGRLVLLGNQVKLSEDPDYETRTSYSFVITAVSNAQSIQQTVTISVNDLDDLPPVLTSAPTTVSVAEASIISASNFATFVADRACTWALSGPDAARLRITHSGSSNTTAQVSIAAGAGAFDYENPLDADQNNVYEVTVTATASNGLTVSSPLAVTVTEVNESPNVTNLVLSASSISEDAAGGSLIGTLSGATDPDGDTLSYSVLSAVAYNQSSLVATYDASTVPFEIVNDNELRTKSATVLDYESITSYSVAIRTSDGRGGNVDKAFTITVLDADEVAPVITGNATPSIAENALIVGVYNANETVTWSLSGTDAALFSISASGVLSFNTAPDYEAPDDADADNVYEVTVVATDASGNASTLPVVVTVTDIVDSIVLDQLKVYLDAATYTSGSTWADSQGLADATLDPGAGTPTHSTDNGGYFSFDGSDGLTIPSVTQATDFDRTDNYTVETWVYLNSVGTTGNRPYILEKWANSTTAPYPYVLRVSSAGTHLYFGAFRLNDGNNSAVTPAVTGQWLHCVGVYDWSNSLLSFYVNGQLAQATSLTIQGSVSNTAALQVGRNIVGAGRLDGRIAAIRTYHKALSSIEVSQNFNFEKSRFGL